MLANLHQIIESIPTQEIVQQLGQMAKPGKEWMVSVATKENGWIFGGMAAMNFANLAIGMGINKFIEHVFHSNPAAPTKILPKGVWTIFNALNKPGDLILLGVFKTMRVVLPFLSKDQAIIIMEDFIGPAFEELEHRWFVQEILLTTVPAIVLGAFCPTAVPLVYSPAAKIARVTLAAGIFALMHTQNWGEGRNYNHGVNTHFLSGTFYSGIYEHTHSLVPGMLLHQVHNFSITLLDKLI